MPGALPPLSLGLGWRPELALLIDRHPDLGFIELMAEDFSHEFGLPPAVERLRRRQITVIPHGVTLSLGSAEPPGPERLAALATLARRVSAPLVSEHLAFVRAAGVEAGHLLPLPRRRDALEPVIQNVRQARAALPVPLAIENIATLFEWPAPEMDEADFLTEVLERADVLLLLDVANVHANARNHGGDPLRFLDRLPLHRLAYVHVGGGFEHGGLYHDTHTHPVPPEVLALLEELCARVPVPGVLLERDDDFPSDDELRGELAAVRDAVERGERRRKGNHEPG